MNDPKKPAVSSLARSIVVEILSSKIEEIQGTKDGKAYHIRKQEGYLHGEHGYPDRFEFSLEKDDNGQPLPPYQPGFYTLSVDSLRVGERQRLGFGFGLALDLLPEVKSVADLKAAQVPF